LSYMAVVFDGMLLEFFHSIATAEHKLATALTRDDKLERGRGWVYGVYAVDMVMLTAPGELTAWQMDGRTYRISALYIDHVNVATTLTCWLVGQLLPSYLNIYSRSQNNVNVVYCNYKLLVTM